MIESLHGWLDFQAVHDTKFFIGCNYIYHVVIIIKTQMKRKVVMQCVCCQSELNSGMIIKVDRNTGARYKTCPHCSAENSSEHVYHRYPSDFGNTPARVTAKNPDGHQSYCNACRSLPKNTPSSNYVNGVLCKDLT